MKKSDKAVRYAADLKILPVGESLQVTGPGGQTGIIYRHRQGYLCGYVFLGSTDCGLTYDRAEELFTVHGGITYFGNQDTFSKGYVIGFDAGHNSDYCPSSPELPWDEVRTVDYMQAELEHLMAQVNDCLKEVKVA